MERRHPRQPPARPLVLLADGHPDTLELYAVSLTPLGFDTTTVSDDAAAFAHVWQMHPDIVVTELSVPGFNGWGFIQDVKRDAHTRDIPVVVVTSDGLPRARERADREGCSAFLLKPCLPEDLAVTLRGVSGIAHAHDHASSSRDGDTKPCPQCRQTLVFSTRYPVLAVGMGLTRARSYAGEAIHYERAWVCRNGGCDYRELAERHDDHITETES